jgi:plastocyanin
MRSRLILLPFAALLACGGGADATGPGTTGGTGGTGGTGSTPVATTAVEMSGTRFNPASIKVASGATVTWTNSDGINHNVTFDGAVGTIPNFSSGTQSLQMPATAGTYTYKCTIHAGMTGSVQVQ